MLKFCRKEVDNERGMEEELEISIDFTNNSGGGCWSYLDTTRR